MDFELPEELRMFKDELRRFVDDEMIPVERETLVDNELKPEFKEKFTARAKELGFYGMDIPEEYGGAGLSVVAKAVVVEEQHNRSLVPCESVLLHRRHSPPVNP